MEALHDVVKAGKARYIGASAMYAWQFHKAQHVAQMNGWTRYVSMQNHMNLIYREDERELVPLCQDMGIALTPYSPLAAGRLTKEPEEQSHRSQTDQIAKWKYDKMAQQDALIIQRVGELAQRLNVSRAQVALAWLMHKRPVTIPIIGATKLSHIESAVPATQLKLSEEDIAWLEEPYVPHEVVGANPPPKA